MRLLDGRPAEAQTAGAPTDDVAAKRNLPVRCSNAVEPSWREDCSNLYGMMLRLLPDHKGVALGAPPPHVVRAFLGQTGAGDPKGIVARGHSGWFVIRQ